jgi:cell division septum initiation protein DivIVA
METQTTASANGLDRTHSEDVLRRAVKRTLPCKLTEREFVEISRARVAKEAELAQLQEDLAKETKRRKDQIGDLEDEIKLMGRELHTGEQDRTVSTNDVFRRHDDGSGWVYTIRLDTYAEVGAPRPASPAEMQRHLPTDELATPRNVLDKARHAQAEDSGDAAVEVNDDGDVTVPDEPEPKKTGKKSKAKE